MNKELKQHVVDFVKGLLGAMAASACIAGMNYVGAHIGDLTGFATTAAAATATIKVLK